MRRDSCNRCFYVMLMFDLLSFQMIFQKRKMIMIFFLSWLWFSFALCMCIFWHLVVFLVLVKEKQNHMVINLNVKWLFVYLSYRMIVIDFVKFTTTLYMEECTNSFSVEKFWQNNFGLCLYLLIVLNQLQNDWWILLYSFLFHYSFD